MKHFGLDIGTQGLRLVQVNKEGTGFRLLSIAYSGFSGLGLQSEAEADHRALAEAIRKLVEESKAPKSVVAGLPEAAVFSRLIEVPPLSDDELSSSIAWEAEQYVPVPLEEVNLDWEVVSRPKKGEKDKKMEVFLVAAPTRLVEKYESVLKLAGLNPVAIETESIAMARSLVPESQASLLLIDFGTSATDMIALRRGEIVLTSSIPTGGAAFTRALKGALKMDESKAEEYKRTYGLRDELEGRIKNALLPLLRVIVTEIKKLMDFYQSQYGAEPLSRVVLTGGTAKMPEVTNFLTDKLGLEVQIGDPFAKLKKDHLLEKFEADVPLFSVAVGLAMKEV